MSLVELIATYGYYAVFLGAFIEGETVLILAGIAAHRGYLDLTTVIGVAFAGGWLGDHIGLRSTLAAYASVLVGYLTGHSSLRFL